ncbi:hypothetical protein GOBAR_AA33348 [Gossypium barbadense]|uniref:Reverse transcriptase n=1 Tax=Gossypium barbadense TaxID=3634 RepID=A0A2P5W8F3_GOSBA|nr:hypothetical protein GOBAR_AA33348 [Gossypium barbadense]
MLLQTTAHEKIGGRREARFVMKVFEKVFNEMALVDVKKDKGWFTWSNNRDGSRFVKERLDRFVISASWVEKVPFTSTEVVRQSCSDHDAIFLDSRGHKPIDDVRNPRLFFKFRLVEPKIGTPSSLSKGFGMRIITPELGHLYAEEESYWAQISRIIWLKELDRNTRFFHVRAMSRSKKNKIEGLNDVDGTWVEGMTNVCKVAWNYFHDLFRSEVVNDIRVMSPIKRCISSDMNEALMGQFTDKEIMDAFDHMDPRKATGIDGLSDLFFKENWDVVGADVLHFCHDVLEVLNHSGG